MGEIAYGPGEDVFIQKNIDALRGWVNPLVGMDILNTIARAYENGLNW